MARAFLLLILSAAVAVSPMANALRASRKRASSPDNYEPARKMPSYQLSCDEHNLMVLKERWRGLGKFDCWWPLTLDEDFWKDGVLSVNRKSWRVFGLQHALQIPLDEFSTLVEYDSLWSGGEKKLSGLIFLTNLKAGFNSKRR